ncbi:MAG: YDG domain-containing protein, partial [Acidocella sp.]|nr:YDG domain-containing protein [Acidocella sp.]
NDPTSGSYASPDVNPVGSPINVTVTGLSISGTTASDYVLASSSANGNIGNITPATLTYVANTDSRTYGAANPIFTGTVTGFVDGQNQGDATSGTLSFTSPANASSPATTATNGDPKYAINGSGLTADNGDYVFVQTAGNATALTINPAVLTVSLIGTVEKTYDETTTATLVAGNYSLSPTENGDVIALNDPTTGTYASPNAGSGIAVTVNGLSISGTKAGDYVLAAPSVTDDVGKIDQVVLTGAIIGDPTKLYDGTNSATLGPNNYELFGFLQGQGGTVTQTSGTYASPNVGQELVTANITGDIAPNIGTDLANYVLPSIVTGEGTIGQNNLNNTIVANYHGPDSLEEILANAHGAMLPVIIIPFPAPAGLFTRGGAIFGSLPTIIQSMTAPATADGEVAVTTGQPLIVSPEEILLQGDREKTWWLTLPDARPVQPMQFH